ncbi:MAG TPA: hypothetical protein VMW27_29055 [Thermoanaerobaculia bacterium]|nr:hypothetical protein [Thermoanaerobaculia bacterium]
MLVCSLLLGLSPLAADSVIQRGTDVFTTMGDGKTFYDFADSPIPAGFFCKGSKAFTGRMAFKGLPLATATPGQLGGGDTVIERLDDAVFDTKGVARTRIQFRALSLVSIAPIKTRCGTFHAYVSLAGKQRVTSMKILRTQEGGGTFAAPLAVDVRMMFIPVEPAQKAARKLELAGSFTFPANPVPWSFAKGAMTNRIGNMVVDTNGDLAPDTPVPGTSNFLPGWEPGQSMDKACCREWVCHAESSGKEHCYWASPPPECWNLPCTEDGF